MFLIIDKEYRVYKNKVLSGKMNSLCRAGKITVIDLKKMKGLNSYFYDIEQENNERWSDIQDLPEDFNIED